MSKKNKTRAKDKAKENQASRAQRVKDRVEHINKLDFETDEQTLKWNDRQIMFYNKGRRSYDKSKGR